MTKDLKNLSLTGNAKLAQIGEHQTGMEEIQGQSPLRVTSLLNLFLLSPCKPLMPTLPTNCVELRKNSISSVLLG